MDLLLRFRVFHLQVVNNSYFHYCIEKDILKIHTVKRILSYVDKVNKKKLRMVGNYFIILTSVPKACPGTPFLNLATRVPEEP